MPLLAAMGPSREYVLANSKVTGVESSVRLTSAAFGLFSGRGHPIAAFRAEGGVYAPSRTAPPLLPHWRKARPSQSFFPAGLLPDFCCELPGFHL